MGRAVIGGESRAVHTKGDGEVLQRDVVDDLVVGALEKGGVDGANGAKSLGRQSGGEEDGVLLRNPDIKELFRHGGGEMYQPRAAGHRAGDPQNMWIRSGKPDEGFAEDVLVIRGRTRDRFPALAADGVEGGRAMEFFGMLDGGFEAFAFFCQDVDEDGHVAMLREFEILLERVEIVAVNGA